jgi:hypothetical protein
MLIVLLEAPSNIAVLDVATVNRLASLGVTHITIARDRATEAIVLEGWAFDIANCAADASTLVAGTARHRSLQPVLQTLITRNRGPGGGTNEHQPPSPQRATHASNTKGSS